MSVKTCASPSSHPLREPKLVKPISELVDADINGPPESPLQTLRSSSPFTQTTLRLKIKNMKSFKHENLEIVFSSAYCRVRGIVVSKFIWPPLPMAITSKPLSDGGEHAKEIGLITSLNFTVSASFIKPISLLRTQENCYN